jgi:hypothetical protein
MKTECLKTNREVFWVGKEKYRVALIKSLIYPRVERDAFEGRAIKDPK